MDRGQGDDTVDGGGDNDIYYVDYTTEVVIEQAHAGFDEVYASVTFTVNDNIEYAELTGSANITLTGGNNGAQLWGNAGSSRVAVGTGSDELSGGFGGIDTLVGGKGDDLYYVLNGSETIVETANEGDDQMQTLISGYKLADNVESLTLLSNVAVGYGNAGDNALMGNGAANTLYGMDGADALASYGGNERLHHRHRWRGVRQQLGPRLDLPD